MTAPDSTMHETSEAPGPMNTPEPTVRDAGKPDSREATVLRLARSPTLLPGPTLTRLLSPRSVALYQTEDPSWSSTSPTTAADGATKASAATFAYLPSSGITGRCFSTPPPAAAAAVGAESVDWNRVAANDAARVLVRSTRAAARIVNLSATRSRHNKKSQRSKSMSAA